MTGVGGTQGLPYPYGLCPSFPTDNCAYSGEQVWNEPDIADVPLATGGAPSQIFPRPSYQTGVSSYQVRTTPDVAYNAAVNGGVLVINLPFIYLVGGTSAGSPQWAGIFALANEARANANKRPIGFSNPALYSIYKNASSYSTDFHDITVGNNTLAGRTRHGIFGWHGI